MQVFPSPVSFSGLRPGPATEFADPATHSTDGYRVSVAFFTQALDNALQKATTTDDVSSMDGKGLRVVLDIAF